MPDFSVSTALTSFFSLKFPQHFTYCSKIRTQYITLDLSKSPKKIAVAGSLAQMLFTLLKIGLGIQSQSP